MSASEACLGFFGGGVPRGVEGEGRWCANPFLCRSAVAGQMLPSVRSKRSEDGRHGRAPKGRKREGCGEAGIGGSEVVQGEVVRWCVQGSGCSGFFRSYNVQVVCTLFPYFRAASTKDLRRVHPRKEMAPANHTARHYPLVSAGKMWRCARARKLRFIKS